MVPALERTLAMVGAPTTSGQIAARFAGGLFRGLLASQMFGVRHGGIKAATGTPLVIFGTVRPGRWLSPPK